MVDKRIRRNVIIGNENQIDDDVIIEENVVIGNNNIIKNGTIIHKNTIIGNHNIILENNNLGSLAVISNHDYCDLKYNGLKIGNHNFFHINNIISSGFYNQTIIGDNNKLLSEIYISHDNIIHDHVTFYPRVFSAGIVEFFKYSNIGAGAYIQQRSKIGAFSMIGMNGVVTRNVMPFMINVNNKYLRVNDKQLCNLKSDDIDNMTIFAGLLNNLLNELIKNNSRYNCENIREIIHRDFKGTVLKHFLDIF